MSDDADDPSSRASNGNQDQEDGHEGRSGVHDEGRHRGGHGDQEGPPSFSGAQAVKYARRYVEELTGQVPESVSGLSQSDKGWKVTLDIVELERVPRTTDVLASYELELDQRGELAGYRRVGRYYRNQVDER